MTLAAAVIMASPLAYGDNGTCTTKKDKTDMTQDATDKSNGPNGSYNDTSHTQTSADQTKAAQKEKNSGN